MKKAIIISIAVIFALSSCTVIHERYQGERIHTEPEYYESAYNYYTYVSPVMWPGYMWWDPLWYYGFYSYYYYPYYRYLYPYYYYGGYYYYPTTTRAGKTYVRKRELRQPSSSTSTTQRTIRKTSTQTRTTSIRTTSNSGTRTRVSSSSSGTRTRVSSSGSSGTKVKKNN
ncbi:MAG: hypothetical protein ACOC57_00630 [Acidobacteriota bacterium]